MDKLSRKWQEPDDLPTKVDVELEPEAETIPDSRANKFTIQHRTNYQQRIINQWISQPTNRSTFSTNKSTTSNKSRSNTWFEQRLVNTRINGLKWHKHSHWTVNKHKHSYQASRQAQRSINHEPKWANEHDSACFKHKSCDLGLFRTRINKQTQYQWSILRATWVILGFSRSDGFGVSNLASQMGLGVLNLGVNGNKVRTVGLAMALFFFFKSSI